MEDVFRQKGLLVDVSQAMAHLKKTAEDLGLEFGDRRMVYNSRLAQEVGAWAQSINKDHEFHMQMFKAYFVDGLNIADHDVLLDLAEKSGLDRHEAHAVITERTFSDAVDADWALAREREIVAVPAAFMEDDRLVGARPYEAYERVVLKYMG